MAIPHIIHQTYKSEATIPAVWAGTPARWRAAHPTWEYVFWSDAALENLIASAYPWFLAQYRSYRYPIQRVDAARYFVLHRFGGVYADLDIVPEEPLDAWVDAVSSEVALVASGHVTSCLTNSFMASAPGASLWPLVHADLARTRGVPPSALARCTKHFTIMTTTGPMMLDRVVRTCATGTVAIFPAPRFATNRPVVPGLTVVSHLPGQSWCSLDTFVFGAFWRHRSLLAGVGAAAIAAVVLVLVAAVARVVRLRAALRKCAAANAAARARGSGECAGRSRCC